MQRNRSGRNNSNWSGGISSVTVADEILSLSEGVIEEIHRRFLDRMKIDQLSECWIWTGSVFKSNGRAKLILGTNFLASRVSYVLYKGHTNGLCVLHTCDNVLCVNPDHLFLGTNADNSTDMVKKGRQAKGEDNGAAKLTEAQVLEIRHILRGRRTLYGLRKKLAARYNVCTETISRIFADKSWRATCL